MSKSSILLTVVANLIPVLGVYFLDWSIFLILLIYWFETFIIGCLCLPRIMLSRAPWHEKFQSLFLFGVSFLVLSLVYLTVLGGFDDQSADWLFEAVKNFETEKSGALSVMLMIGPILALHGWIFWKDLWGGKLSNQRPSYFMLVAVARIFVLQFVILTGAKFTGYLTLPDLAIVLFIIFKLAMEILFFTGSKFVRSRLLHMSS